MDDLGIIYESSPPRFPDMIGRRRVGGKWQRVRIEFEYKSSNFKEHGPRPLQVRYSSVLGARLARLPNRGHRAKGRYKEAKALLNRA